MDRASELEKLEDLKKQHRELDKKANELSTKFYLTPQEEEELRKLKIEKLRLKDEIFNLSTKLGIDI